MGHPGKFTAPPAAEHSTNYTNTTNTTRTTRTESTESAPGAISSPSEVSVVQRAPAKSAASAGPDKTKKKKQQQQQQDTVAPDTATLSFRLSSGEVVVHRFAATATLDEVCEFLDAETAVRKPYRLMTNFPRHQFSREEYPMRLLDLNLAPRTSLIVSVGGSVWECAFSLLACSVCALCPRTYVYIYIYIYMCVYVGEGVCCAFVYMQVCGCTCVC
jgi:UBX domain